MMLAVILASFSAGAIFTLLLLCLWIMRFGSRSQQSIPSKPQTESFQLPKELLKLLNDPELKSKKETCIFLNLLFQFLFRELKDTKFVRRWVVRKMNAEFAELLQTTSGKLLDKISVRDFNFGSTFPIVNNATIRHSRMSEDEQCIEELDIALDIEYNGGFHLAVDADIVFNKSAYLSVTVTELKGCLRLQFSRNPYTHWSLAFYEDPTIEFNVESRFGGRPIPQITSLIINQIRRSIKKKHTLPNYKMRYKPFFMPQEAFVPCQDLYFRGNRIGEGSLEITVIECSRLLKPPAESSLYCTVSLGSLPWFELVRVRKTFVTIDVQIIRSPGQPIGLLFKEDFLLERYESVVVIEAVSADGPAAHIDIKKHDILVAVGNQKVTSQKQAAKLLKNAGERLTIRLERACANKSSDSNDIKFEEDFINIKDVDDMNKNKKDREEDFVNISVKSVNGETKSLQGSPTASQKRSSVASLLRRRTKSNVGDNSSGESPQSSPEVCRRTTTTSSDTKDILTRSPMTSPKKQSLVKRDKSLSNSDPQINTAGKSKLSGGGLDDQAGLDQELESEGDSEEETDVRKTGLVPACQDPLWNERFKFEVEEGHKYLNVCVRCKIHVPEKLERNEKLLKAEKDMLLGYVSLPLSDIALDCLMTLQGDIQRTVNLSPEETKAGASRAKLPNLGSHPGFDPNLCYGDITLGFQHMPHKSSLEERKRLTKHASTPSFTDTPHPKKSIPTTDIANRLDEGLHRFVVTEFKTATYCHFCGKKIWLKTAFQCTSCAMICHKKCTEKCQAQTLCRKDCVRRRSHPDVIYKIPTIETDKKKTGEEMASKSGGILSKFRKDSAGKRGKSPSTSPMVGRKIMAAGGNQIKVERSPFFIRRRNSAPDDNDSDSSPSSGGFLTVGRIPRTRSTTSLQNLVHQNAAPALSSEDFKNGDKLGESSGDEGELTMSQTAVIEALRPSGKGHNKDEMVVTAAKQMGKELYLHLTLEERKEKLDAMVSKLQQEIDVEAEHRAELSKAEQESLNSNQKRILQCKIAKADEKIQALMVLMLHYCAGLQHCMDLEEEKRQQVDGKGENEDENTESKSISELFAHGKSEPIPTVGASSDLDDLDTPADIESSGEFEVEMSGSF